MRISRRDLPTPERLSRITSRDWNAAEYAASHLRLKNQNKDPVVPGASTSGSLVGFRTQPPAP